jgi:hypothetical protein
MQKHIKYKNKCGYLEEVPIKKSSEYFWRIV